MAESISDLLQDPPKEDLYAALKIRLTEQYALSETKKLEMILDGTEIGDQRPSQLLHKLKSLAGTNYPSKLIKSLWMRKLPKFIHIALVPQQDIYTVDELAKTADELNEALHVHEHSIHQLSIQSRPIQQKLTPYFNDETYQGTSGDTTVVQSPHNNNEIGQIKELVAQISSKFAQFTNQNRKMMNLGTNQTSTNNRVHYRNRSRSRGRNQISPDGVCWYHYRFGARAQKCVNPCSFNTPSTDTKN